MPSHDSILRFAALTLILGGCGVERLAGGSDEQSAAETPTTMGGTDDSTGDAGSGGDADAGQDMGAESEPDSGPEEEPDGGHLFVPEDDIVCSLGCDPFAQDCPAGEKCVAYASAALYWDANKCVPVTGDQLAGEACTYTGSVEALDDCDEHSACWDVHEIEGEWTGVCRSFCNGSADNGSCPSPEDSCLISNEGSVSLCVRRCDPLAQDCDEGSLCTWTAADFQCVGSLHDEGTPLHEACGFYNDCDQGLMCVGADLVEGCAGSACCASFCDLSEGPSACAGIEGGDCAAFFEPESTPPGLESIGLCLTASP